MDPRGKVALSISNQTPEAGISGPGSSETMSFEGADGDAENSCSLFLVKK